MPSCSRQPFLPTRADDIQAWMFALGGLVLSGLLLLGGLLWSGWKLNDLKRASETMIVHHMVDDLTSILCKNVHDYAFWDEALDRLQADDLAWLDESIGAYMWSTWRYDFVFAVASDGSTSWAYVDGQRSSAQAASVLGADLMALLARARIRTGEPVAVSATFLAEGGPLAAAAGQFVRSSTDRVEPDAPAWFLVMGQRLDGLVAGLEAELVLPGVRLGLETPDPSFSRIDLLDVRDQPIAFLSWRASRVGSETLTRLAPIVLAAMAVLLASILLSGKLAARGRNRVQASEQRFRDFADIEADWLWETGPDHRLTYVSDRFGQLVGVDSERQLGMFCWEYPAERQASSVRGWDLLQAAVERGDALRNLQVTLPDAQGNLLHLRISARPVHDPAGAFLGYRGIGSNITEEAEAQARAQFLAQHDVLTGLPNRLLLRERLAQDLARAARSGKMLALLCLDLDRFKAVNDLYGHSAGDALLCTVAARLAEELRGQDTAARLGGDEFVVVLPDIGSPDGAVRVAGRLVERLTEPFHGGSFEALVGASIGIALFPSDAADGENLLRCADIALYRAKGAGRGQACLFAPEMDRRLQARRQLELDLRRALAEPGQLLLHYQPQFDVATDRLVGFEALARWRHPSNGFLPPDQFIPLAEDTGLIVPLGSWALHQACRDATSWPSGLTVSVNLSPAQFRHHGLVATIRGILEDTGMQPSRLQLEITENVLLNDTDSILTMLNDLKAMGIRVVMDDFGTGYSSLAYLRRFSFDEIKIDRRFTQELGKRADARAIVDAALSLGRNLHMMATAEGVESATQLQRLKDMGCRQVQGFYCGRPLPADSVTAALEDDAVGLDLNGWIAMTARQELRPDVQQGDAVVVGQG